MSQWRMGLKALLKTKMKFHLMIDAGMTTLGEGSIAGSNGSLADSFYVSFGIETPLTNGR